MPVARYELDARGRVCPLPLLMAKQRLAGMSAGDRLSVWVTDPASFEDFTALTCFSGCRLLDVEARDGARRYCLEKG